MGCSETIFVDESIIDFPIFLLFFNTSFPSFPIFSILSEFPVFLFFSYSTMMLDTLNVVIIKTPK